MPPAGKRESVRREQLVEATLRLIERGGVDAVTHRAAAAEAGVAAASTTYYFDSKQALVQEALELVIERSTALLRRHTAVTGTVTRAELVDRLAALSAAQLGDATAPLIVQFELMLEAGRRPELRPLAERWEIAYMDGLAGLVLAAGLPHATVTLVASVLEGALLSQLSLPRERFVEDHLRPQLVALVQAASAAPPYH